MKIQVEKSVVTFNPENQAEKDALQKLWEAVIGCNGPTLKLCPVGEYTPSANDKGAMFFIEGMEHSKDAKSTGSVKPVEYNPKVVTEDCSVYCSICNKTIDLKAGDTIPLCCGRLMVNLDA
ncbi:MAG: hypothetical protein LBC72_00105 [Spirochaetaceae bacterium]|jgi:hypothetical protein|nr:hypothetical protein [Spirochaetaceae bacterium]